MHDLTATELRIIAARDTSLPGSKRRIARRLVTALPQELFYEDALYRTDSLRTADCRHRRDPTASAIRRYCKRSILHRGRQALADGCLHPEEPQRNAHGGGVVDSRRGWEHGDKSGNSGAQFLANAGFVTASLTYRLSGEAPFPAQIEDAKCAIRYLRANAAKYGIDPERMGAAGSSAGGHLAQLIATADQNAGLEGHGGWQNVSSKVQAAVSYFGPSDLTASAKQFPKETEEVIARFMGGNESEKPALYREASPILYVSKNDPPLLLVHGESDEDVPFDQSVRMFESYRRAGLPVEFIAVENAGHDFRQMGATALSPSLETIHQRTVDFFKHYLASIPSAAGRR